MFHLKFENLKKGCKITFVHCFLYFSLSPSTKLYLVKSTLITLGFVKKTLFVNLEKVQNILKIWTEAKILLKIGSNKKDWPLNMRDKFCPNSIPIISLQKSNFVTIFNLKNCGSSSLRRIFWKTIRIFLNTEVLHRFCQNFDQAKRIVHSTCVINFSLISQAVLKLWEFHDLHTLTHTSIHIHKNIFSKWDSSIFFGTFWTRLDEIEKKKIMKTKFFEKAKVRKQFIDNFLSERKLIKYSMPKFSMSENHLHFSCEIKNKKYFHRGI